MYHLQHERVVSDIQARARGKRLYIRYIKHGCECCKDK